jgi:hypothetical protein
MFANNYAKDLLLIDIQIANFLGIAFLLISIVFSLFAVSIENGLLFRMLKSYWATALGNPIFKYPTVIRHIGIDMVESIKYNHGYNEQKAK